MEKKPKKQRIKLHYHKRRTEEARPTWLEMARQYNDEGKSPEEIRKNFINPKTGKPYTRGHVYWALDQVGTKVKK